MHRQWVVPKRATQQVTFPERSPRSRPPGRLTRLAAQACLGAGFSARTIMLARPEFLISPTWGGMALAAVAGLVMALAASLAPARVIARLAPADVFRR